MAEYVAALDVTSTSIGCTVFDRKARIVAVARKEHRAIRTGQERVTHDPLDLWDRTQQVLRGAVRKGRLRATEIRAIGVTADGGTAMVWDRTTGRPLGDAIGSGDRRTGAIVVALCEDGGADRFRSTTGRSLDEESVGARIRWLLDDDRGLRARAERGEVLAGGIEAWLTWNLTGGPRGGVHVTDASAASGTTLMGLQSLTWEERALEAFEIPRSILGRIEPSSRVVGTCVGDLAGVPLAGVLASPQAATFGQAAFEPGDAKVTTGAGSSVVMTTGGKAPRSKDGPSAAVGWVLGDRPPVYCLRADIPATGALLGWLGANLGLARDARDVADLARKVDGSAGVVIVPAFEGLRSPTADPSARGVIVGLTDRTDRAHVARAAVEATAWQARQVLDVMADRAGAALRDVRIDGEWAGNASLMQAHADLLGVRVVRSKVRETAALGAAFAAGLAVGYWDGPDALREVAAADESWSPRMPADEVAAGYARWKRAVDASRGWA